MTAPPDDALRTTVETQAQTIKAQGDLIVKLRACLAAAVREHERDTETIALLQAVRRLRFDDVTDLVRL